MTTMRTYTCTTCGASLATSAPPGTIITCEYCHTPFTVPSPSLDQPGDSQATVVANFNRRGNPSPMPPAGPDGTPPSTPELPPDPDSPAGVGNTVDSDAGQPMVERGSLDAAPTTGDAAAEAPLVVAPETTAPEPNPELSPEPELRAPEIIEELDAPDSVAAPEPEPEMPPAVDPRSPAGAEAAGAAQTVVTPEGVSAADIIAEPTKYGAGIPAEQGEPILVPPNQVKIIPPQTPAVGGPPGAAMRSGNRTPLLIGGGLLLLCCLLTSCAVVVGVVPALLSALGGG